ncbi:MAG TPA: extracellular solute-binding protein [Alphaproteobacteria bacterium]
MSAGFAASAEELPKSLQKMLDKIKLPAEVTANINEEVNNISPAIVAAAKKEKRLDVSGSMDVKEFAVMVQPFKERYPEIDVRYSSGDQFSRNIRPLIAYKEGRVLTDIVEGLGVNLSEYKQEGALLKLDDIPNVKNVPAEMNDKDGYYVGPRIRYWCMTYNTDKVKVSELPKTWDDMLTMPGLRNGRMGLGNRPNNFMIMLWGAKGPEWSNNYMEKLFTVVKPQLRKEGADGLVTLVAAGELDMAFPTASYRTAQSVEKGAPIGWWCPTPVPVSSSAMVILNKSPHPNAGKLYINWFLSKEGQIAQNYADGSPPIHKELQQKEFFLYADQTMDRPSAPRTPQLLEEEMPKVAKIWDRYWLGGGARPPATVNTGLVSVNKNGAEIRIQGATESMETVAVNNTRTKISVAGKEAKRSDLKVGMMCKISYAGENPEASEIVCQ